MSYFYQLNSTGTSIPIRHISLRSLLPNTEQFMTYEGSTTHPGCWESTVWIILNKPIYITKQEVSQQPLSLYLKPVISYFLSFQLYVLRRLMQGNEQTPKAPLGNNARPLQPLHHRTVRTNIDFMNTNKVRDPPAAPISNDRPEGGFNHPLRNTHSAITSLPQNQNCPSMYKDMFYRANKWTADLTMRTSGRERGITDLETVFHTIH